jgi:hypothetical protein
VFGSNERQSTSDKVDSFFDVATKALKIAAYVFIGCSVVLLSMLSKGSLLLAATNLRPPHAGNFIFQPESYLVCQNQTEVIYKNMTRDVNNFTLCVMMARNELQNDVITTAQPSQTTADFNRLTTRKSTASE